MDGNAKSDLEHSTEKAVRVSVKSSAVISRVFRRLIVWGNRVYQRNFSSSLRALKKDGPTRELSVSPALTKEEAKIIIANAKANGIIIGIKKMQPDGEVGTNQSLHQQEKMAKNEIKLDKWKERSKTYKKVPIINTIAKNKTQKYSKLSKEDNETNKDDRFIILCNKSRLAFLNEQLELITKLRVQKMSKNELEDINKDGIVDPKDYEPLVTRDVNLTPNQLTDVGKDYGTCMVKDYNKNYCLQRITKAQYCEIREALFELSSHGACVLNDNEMLVAINSSELEQYREYAPSDRPIKEFGSNGARSIETESNSNDIMQVEVPTLKEFNIFKERYKGKDFIAQYNPNGTVSVIVREKDTEEMVEDAKKKSQTADLLKEADEFAEKNAENIIETTISKEVEEKEEELAR